MDDDITNSELTLIGRTWSVCTVGLRPLVTVPRRRRIPCRPPRYQSRGA